MLLVRQKWPEDLFPEDAAQEGKGVLIGVQGMHGPPIPIMHPYSIVNMQPENLKFQPASRRGLNGWHGNANEEDHELGT